MEELPSPENIKSQIEQLLSELDKYAINELPEEIRERLSYEWFDAEMAVKCGKDKDSEQALKHLRQFVDKLSKIPMSHRPEALPPYNNKERKQLGEEDITEKNCPSS